MKTSFETSRLAALSRLIDERMGVSFPPSRWNDLERAFCRAAADLGFRDQQECINWFLAAPASPEQTQSLAAYLTTGETYFLREGRIFEILEQEIVPEIIRSRTGSEKRLRFWSAGCASGEEPYTLAVMLHRMGASLRDWNISILATDINPQALRKAAEGVYTKWSFRDTPAWFRDNYFSRKGDHHFELLPAIKKMVRFAYLNLVKAPIPSPLPDINAMDVIFCRNVLMYFNPERTGQAIERFRHSLVEGGWLVVSSCEVSIPLFSGFKAINFSGLTLFQKQTGSRNNATRKGEQISSLPLGTPCPRQILLPPAHRAQTTALPQACPPAPIHCNDTGTTSLLCRIRANEGRLEEALLLSEQALCIDKLDPALHYLRAMILQEQGAVDEAEAALKRAIYLDRDMVLAHFTLGNITLRRGKGRESRRHFDHALTILARYQPEDLLPESEGMPAGRLTEIIKACLPACNEGE